MTIAGTYQHVKDENFLEYLRSWNVPEDKIKTAESRKSNIQVAVDGKKISVTSDSGTGKTTSTFVLDEEVDEPMPNNTVFKSIAKLSGDTLSITSKTSSGKNTSRVYTFSDDGLVLTLSHEGSSLTAKRTYKKI